MTHVGEHEWAEFFGGAMDPGLRERVLTHAQACPDCWSEMVAVARLVSLKTVSSLGASTAPRGGVSMRPLLRGERVGRFSIRQAIGAGAMGAVYAAYDPELDRRLALKLLHANHDDEGARARFVGEGRAMAKLTHPNVVAIYDVGTFEGRGYLVMELVQGRTLAQWLEVQPRSIDEIVDVFVQAGRGLSAAHAAGLVHRDFKPHNLMMADDGRVVVTDFGLAHVVDTSISEAARDSAELASVTARGRRAGTPAYMAPEQFAGGRIDARTDQFAFCVSLHEALTGQRPFAGKSVEQLAIAVIEGRRSEPERLRDVPPRIRAVVSRGLAIDPDERFASMDALLRELEANPSRTRKRRLVWGTAASVGLGATGWGFVAREPPCAYGTARVEAVWNDERKAAIAQGLREHASGYADDAIARVNESLDGYASQWVRAHRDACEATRVRGEQSEQLLDLRMACLQHDLHALAALVDVLQRPDAAVARRATRSAMELPPVQRCADTERLLSGVGPPEPHESATAAMLRSRLAITRARVTAGRPDDAERDAMAVLEAASGLAYRPLRAEAHALLALVRIEQGKYAAALTDLEEAWLHAEATRHEELAAEVASELTSVLGSHLGDAEVGRRWAKQAEAAVDRIGRPARARGKLLDAMGTVEEAAGEFATARRLYEEALAIWEREPEAHPQALLSTQNNLAGLLVTMGELEAGHRFFVRALELSERLNGPTHPDTAACMLNLGSSFEVRGELDLARNWLDQARTLTENAYGPAHPEVATVLFALGNTTVQQGQFDDAQAFYTDALRIWEAALGSAHPRLGAALDNLGFVQLQQEKYAEAIPYFERARAINEAALGPDHPAVAHSYVNLGNTALGSHDAARADRYFAQAYAIAERAYGADHPELAHVAIGWGRAHIELDHADEAIRLLEQAVRIVDAAEVEPAVRGEARFALAIALDRAGRRAAALDEARVAGEHYGRADGRFEAQRQRVAAFLSPD